MFSWTNNDRGFFIGRVGTWGTFLDFFVWVPSFIGVVKYIWGFLHGVAESWTCEAT